MPSIWEKHDEAMFLKPPVRIAHLAKRWITLAAVIVHERSERLFTLGDHEGDQARRDSRLPLSALALGRGAWVSIQLGQVQRRVADPPRLMIELLAQWTN